MKSADCARKEGSLKTFLFLFLWDLKHRNKRLKITSPNIFNDFSQDNYFGILSRLSFHKMPPTAMSKVLDTKLSSKEYCFQVKHLNMWQDSKEKS
uniref:Uncharacterized protein n=1 Tax=Rhizophora mucronata TaxID=61149 RepID=A0A2P2QMC1_RHIMU